MYGRLVTAATLLAAAAAPMQAQSASLFQNAWFWGVHAGATHIGTTYASGASGSVGAEWMLTRSVAGLYLSYDQASFTRTGAIADASEPSGVRPVSIHDLRTGSIAALAFPVQWGNFRPYGGVGFAISVIGSAAAQTDNNSAPDQTVSQNVENARSRSSIFFLGGGQWQLRKLALFGQLSVTPSSNDFLIDGTVTQLSAGVRYNFGSSLAP